MTTTIPTGKFVWFDYVGGDRAKVLGFYGELFGWKTQDIPIPGGGEYTLFQLEGQAIGGYMKTPTTPKEAQWVPHLQVESAQATADQVKALGGAILRTPNKMADFGTMAVVADPLQGVFALWQPSKVEGTGDYKGVNGAWCWNELFTTDPAKSIAFYAKVGGFTDETMQMPKGEYHVLNAGGQARAGVMKPPVPMKQQWMPYIQVANVDQTIERAKRLGATIHLAGEDVPGVGRIGMLTDSQGGMLGVLTPAK